MKRANLEKEPSMTRRPHLELQSLDLDRDWQPLPGFAGLEMQLIADDLDEGRGTGARSRLVRFAPGVSTSGTLRHPYWEEVYLLAGDLQPVGGDGAATQAPACSIRPPGTPHGPFASRAGCVLLEVQYFAHSPSRDTP